MNIEKSTYGNIDYKIIHNPRETKFSLYCFPGCFQGGWVDGIAVEFPSFGWCGSFASGDISPNGVTGVYGYPELGKLLVISKGQGFIVDPQAPNNTVELKEQPILGVISNENNNLLVIYDFVRFTAYGHNGREWKTEALSFDGIKIKEVSESFVVGYAWSAPEKNWVEFTLNIKTGEYKGGAR